MSKRKGGGRRDSQLLSFHQITEAPLSAGAFVTIASPQNNVSNRAAVEADTWAHFRILSLSLRLHPRTTQTGTLAVGFIGGVQDTPPTTVFQVLELLPSAILSTRASVPTEWVRVPRADLAGPLPWYKTIPGSADATEESPGVICVAGTGTDTFTLELRGVFEFKTAVNTNNTPAAASMRACIRRERVARALATERELLLRILGSAVPSGITPVIT